MCGRFTSLTPPDVLAQLFESDITSEIGESEFHPNFNVAPSTRIFAIASTPRHGRVLGRLRWGLVPHWAKDPVGTGQINARSETISEKPTFRDSFRKRRCIIPMTGYYEWRTIDVGESLGRGTGESRSAKRAVYVTRTDGKPMAVAGLWSIWTNPISGEHGPNEQLRTCCVVTRDANSTLASVHDRMPVVLEKEDWSLWLGEDSNAAEAELQALLRSDPDDLDLGYVDVGTFVNNVRNNGPELIVPVG
jgi:putative SOS response-associated peptidase YedK